MDRHNKIVIAALSASALFVLAIIASSGQWMTKPASEIDFPIAARLLPAASPAPAAAIDRPIVKPLAMPRQTKADVPVPIRTSPKPQQPPGENNYAVASLPAAIRQLPDHVVLRYAVLYRDDGFKLGTATYTWKASNGRYSLLSVAEASGIAALFLDGKVVNSSEGQIAENGLMPEKFWISRKGVRKEFADLDWHRHRLELPEGKVETLPPQTQDLLSFIFHLAMTARDEQSSWTLPVTSGKNLKDYRFRAVGIERIEVLGKPTDTLHIKGTRLNEGDADVWLDPALHWLPIRIRNVDTKGTPIVQNLLTIGD